MANSAIVGILRALLMADTASFDAAMKRSADSAKAWSRDLRTVGQQATQVGSALTKTLTLPLAALAIGSAKAAMDFESSFANVRKTVGASVPVMDAFAKEIRQMAKDIPATTDELNKIAALGGQMGVPIDQLEHFTRNVAALGVAVDGISTEDAAAGLAQIGNATGTGTTKVAEMASALVHLGNKSNATEADILEFTKRLVGAGHTVGMTVPEIMALGTAMANVGINAEAGGTAMSTVISKISKAVSSGGSALKEFASVANLSADEFAATWQRSPIQAINAFIKGLSSMKERGIDLNLTMGELGTEGIRVQDTLKRLAGASDGVANSLTIANEGFSAGNKHLEEAEKKYATTANQLKLLWNQIRDVGITFGTAMMPAIRSATDLLKSLLPAIEGVGRAFAELPGPIQLGVIGIGGLVAAIGPMLFISGQLALSASSLAGAFAKNGLAMKALQGLVGPLGASLGFLANPITLIVGGLGLLAFGIYKVATAETELEKSLRTNTEAFKDNTKQLDSALSTYQALAGKQNLTKQETIRLDHATRELAKASGLSADAFKKEEAGSDTLTAALREQLKARKELLAEAINQARGEWMRVSEQLAHTQEALTRTLLGQTLTTDPTGRTVREMNVGERVKEVTRLNGVIAELEKQAASAKESYQKLAGVLATNIALPKDAFIGPLQAGQKQQQAFADAVRAASAQIQQEIKGTGLSVGQLTKMLGENEVAFKAGAKAMGLNAETVSFLEQQLQKQKKATTDTTKATKELAKETEEQTRALAALGIITKNEVNKQFGELNALWSIAVAKGVPLQAVVKLMGPAYQELADKAKKSDVALTGLNETLALQRSLAKTPVFNVSATLGLPASVLAGMKTFNADTMDATRSSVLLKNAYKAFGLETRDELRRTAVAMRQHYTDLLAVGFKNEADRKASLQRVLEAERAAAGETVSIWTTQIFPSIKGVVENLTTAVNGSFAQMLLGAKGFKDGFVDIWQSIKAAILNVFNSILSAFVNQFLKGLIGALSGQSGAWSKAFQGLMGGGGGVNWAGMARNVVGVGSAVAGGTTAASAYVGSSVAATEAAAMGTSVGVSTAAIVATAGIAAAVIAAWAIYKANKNDTKKVRDAFAEALGFKDLSLLYKQLTTMGARGKELAAVGQGVIGKKDQAANEQWMKDVERFMKSVENFQSIVTAATGNIAAGFTGKIAGLFQQQTKDQLKSYDDQIEAARDNAEEVKRLETEKAQFIKATQAEIVASTQAEFNRISRITLGSYTAARAQGQSAVQAVQTVGPAIDALKASADQFGFAGNAAFETLLKWRELVGANAPLLDSVAGLTDLMRVLADTGHLDKQMFADLQAQGLSTYQSLIDAGFTEKQAREAIKPLIETEIRLAKEKGYAIDEGTAAIIAQMRANGELKADEESLISVFKAGFSALLKFLKVDLPEGWRTTMKAAEDAASTTERRWGGMRFRVPVDFDTSGQPSGPLGFTVPGAQHGGIVTSPQLIGVGEAGPEAIIPLSRLGEFGMGPISGVTIVVKTYLDSRQIAQAQTPYLTPEVKRIGLGKR